jgi:periplasmic protein TonB
LSAYRTSSPSERPPLKRRASGLALALAVNLGLLFILLGLGRVAPVAEKASQALVVDLIPESRRAEAPTRAKVQRKSVEHPRPKPPPIVLPAKPTISVPPPPPPTKTVELVELSKEDMAAGDIGNLPKTGSASAGDSEVVGQGPNGETLYAAQWARHPTDAELGGYLPSNAPDGWGLIACRTIPGDRVEDCIELDQEPRGSHLASSVRQAAWQFRIRPPRKNGRALVGSWVSIRIDYERIGRGRSSGL